MIQADYRVGGTTRYFVSERAGPLMLVPDEVRKCVLFVGFQMHDGTWKYAGTAFWVNRRIAETDHSFMYVVTAKHVIEGIKGKGLDKVYLRMNFKDGVARWVETELRFWLHHPTDPAVDVAALPLALPKEQLDQITYPIDSFATESTIDSEQIGVGDEVFITGLFHVHRGKRRNIPIVRVGNIAAMPEEQIETGMGLADGYLIEARSIGGLSGSPVFVHLGTARIMNEHLYFATGQTIYYLLGLVHGHWDVPIPDVADFDELAVDATGQGRAVNMGIAIVVPASKILEVIQQPVIREYEEAVEADFRKKGLPMMDAAEEESAGDRVTQEGFLRILEGIRRPMQPSPDEEAPRRAPSPGK
jgi:hypothetical protein